MRSPELVADCTRCAALCCVLLPFRADAGFGADKDGGTPCRNLDGADLCTIHPTLREDGWPGCAVFDCFGAGQQVTQVTYGGRSWRDPAVNRGEMAAVLSVMRLLHEALSHLTEVAARSPDPGADALRLRIGELTDGTPDELLALDLETVLVEVSGVLRAASLRVRGVDPDPAEANAEGADLAGHDLAGHDLAGQDLRGRDLVRADLRGALLIAADLRGRDLTDADLLGADVRDADVRGARLERALFLTRSQVGAMRGDRATTLPPVMPLPLHWL